MYFKQILQKIRERTDFLDNNSVPKIKKKSGVEKKGISLCLVIVSCSGLESKKKTKVRTISSLESLTDIQGHSYIYIYPRNTKRSKTKQRNGGNFFYVEIAKSVEQINALLCLFYPFIYISFIHTVFLYPSLNWYRLLSHQTATISHSRHPKKRATAPAPPPSASSSA